VIGTTASSGNLLAWIHRGFHYHQAGSGARCSWPRVRLQDPPATRLPRAGSWLTSGEPATCQTRFRPPMQPALRRWDQSRSCPLRQGPRPNPLSRQGLRWRRCSGWGASRERKQSKPLGRCVRGATAMATKSRLRLPLDAVDSGDQFLTTMVTCHPFGGGWKRAMDGKRYAGQLIIVDFTWPALSRCDSSGTGMVREFTLRLIKPTSWCMKRWSTARRWRTCPNHA